MACFAYGKDVDVYAFYRWEYLNLHSFELYLHSFTKFAMMSISHEQKIINNKRSGRISWSLH